VSAIVEAEGTSTFIVELEQFSGPLDLLLALIREEEVEITDIPIARICEQFLARIHGLALSDAAEYLEMAARLLRIKAQMLLPRSQDDESWEDPRAELVRRLLEYQQMREVVDVLEDRSEERRNRFARGWLPTEPMPPSSPLALSLPELLSAIDRVLRVATRPTLHDIVPRALDVDGAMAGIRALLGMRLLAQWSDVVRDDAEPWQILSALLALLELARRGELKLVQMRPFGVVEISRDAASEAA
jgi:segregation and condensation protein A